MEPYEVVGTAPETVLHLRDVVRPLVVKMVAKRAASYPDLLTADDREDLVGVVMEKYHKRWGRSAGPDHLGAWLKPVVDASIIDELRRRQVRPKRADLPENPDDGIPFEQMFVSLVTPSAQTHYTKLLDDALRALGREYPDDPGLIFLRYVEGLELAEIAPRLEVSEETAKKRVQRATSRLRTILTRLAGSPGT